MIKIEKMMKQHQLYNHLYINDNILYKNIQVNYKCIYNNYTCIEKLIYFVLHFYINSMSLYDALLVAGSNIYSYLQKNINNPMNAVTSNNTTRRAIIYCMSTYFLRDGRLNAVSVVVVDLKLTG